MAIEGADNGSGGGDAARVMAVAGEQIGLALDESQPSVDQLGDALQRLADCLSSLPVAGSAATELNAIRSELSRAITGLQFHDRMTQHLTHVRSYLLDGAEHVGPEPVPGDGAWEQLHRRLSARLLTEAHRARLDLNFPKGYFGERVQSRPENLRTASISDVELF